MAIEVEVIKTSTLTCPECGFSEELEMPTDTCLFFHPCSNCQVTLRPQEGDCCVFCSYGSVKCPSMQANPEGGCGC